MKFNQLLKARLIRKSRWPHLAVHKVRATGMLVSHYAPVTPMEIHSVDALWRRALQLAWQGYKVAVLKLGDDGECFESRGITSFYMPALAGEYGRVLYATLHRLDHAGFDRLLAEAPPATQEWLAINDQMRRGAQESNFLEGEQP